MDNNEHQLLTQFLDQLVQAQGINKNSIADTMIRSACAQQPDAAYLLVQKALLQEQALKNAKAKIDQLQTEIGALRSQLQGNTQQPVSSGLSGFLGGDSFVNSGNTAPRPAAASGYVAPVQAAAPATGGSVGGFLTNMATTAAGVAGGAFLFEGISSLFGHHSNDHSGGFLSSNDGFSNLPGQNVENVTVNNYYEGDTSGNDDTDNDDDQDDDDDSSDDS